jgi:hypothetical protein
LGYDMNDVIRTNDTKDHAYYVRCLKD